MSEKLTDTSHEASDAGKTAIPRADENIDPGKMTEAPGGGVDTSFTTNLGQIGDYRLVREVGRGGMGIVYEAEQISLRRRVALKILPFAGGADARQLQRFRNEAEAAAHLHHSNIVPVFAVGSERGVHFYAMQFIEGQSLAALISDMSGDATGSQSGAGQALLARPRTPVSTMVAQSTLQSARTRVFFQTVATIGKQTAEALEYAHQMGVVHRDIKPANLLLDASGRVWVTDFGLAQFQNQAGVTVTGELLGTLRYVSPEQAMAKRGLVGNLTDIYSLGATLYELLSLKPVFDARDRHALLHQVAFDEPAPPRSIDPSIPFELETIVLKALSKTPAERYGSAQEMADDLQRFLEDKPIQAKRPSLVERSRKWMRRHPALVAATLLVLGLGVIGFGVSTAMVASEQAKTQAAYESERLQKAETEAALKREEKRAREAEQLFQLARRSVDDMIALSVEELSDNHAMLALRRELLEAALVYYDEFIELRRENPNAQAELAATRDRVKHLLEDLAVLQGAGQHFLLKQQAVLGELKATKEQRKNFDQLLRDWEKDRQELFKGFHKIPPEERQSRFATLARKNDAAIAKVLSAGQLARFKQIDIQSKGPLAFREPEIAAALKLTAEQKNKIRAIEAGSFVDAVALAKPGPPEAMFRKVQEDRRQATMRQIIDVLTEEQAHQWRELTGPALAEPIFMPAAQRPFSKGLKKGP